MIARKVFLSLLVAVAMLAAEPQAWATVYYWDANGGTAGTGGDGTWDTATSLWRSPLVTDPLTTWPTSGTDNDASFVGTPGSVMISGGVTANDLTLGASGLVTISGGALTLNGTTSNIKANAAATIASKISGSANLTKAGADTLTLSGANDYSGVTTVSASILSITSNLALGTTAGGTTIADGTQLRLSNNITVTGEALTILGGFGSDGALNNLSGNNTWTGSVGFTGQTATGRI